MNAAAQGTIVGSPSLASGAITRLLPIRIASEATTAPTFLVASAAGELGIVIALSVLFPFLIHILPVPDDARLGPRLLPIFYAPLLAALLGRPRSAFAVALAAPWLNWLLTRHPSPPTALVTMLQLVVFVTAIRLLLPRLGRQWFLAVPAYLAAMMVATLLVAIAPRLTGGAPAMTWALRTITIGLPGIAVLLLINALAVRLPAGPDGGGPRTA